MTGSDQDGEALSAIRMANKLLKERKLTWKDVISTHKKDKLETIFEEAMRSAYTRREYKPTYTDDDDYYDKPRHKQMAEAIWDAGTERLTEKEKNFVKDMMTWNRPTPAQLSWLELLFQRYA